MQPSAQFPYSLERLPMKFSAGLLTLGLLCSVSPAWADATPEEAQRLTQLFQSYLLAEPGVVTVTPNGPSYATRFDLMRLAARLGPPGFSASLTPIEWTITPQGAGKWKVDQDQPLSVAAKLEGKFDFKAQIGAITGTGIFDEALGTFASTATEFRQVAIEQTVIEQGQPARTSYTLASLKAQSASTGTGGNVDGSSTQSYSGFRQMTSIPAAADGSAPAMEFTLSSPEGTQSLSYVGLRVKAMNELLAWGVALQSKQAAISGQAELKDKLRAALPLWGRISGDATMKQVSLNSIAGNFGLAELGVSAEINGISADGRLQEKFTFTGLSVPQELVPQWASGLVPKNFSIDFDITDFDLAAPAALIIDRLDLAKNPPLPEGFEDELMPAFLPKGTVTIGLAPSEILAPLFQFTAEGSMTAGPVATPQGTALLKLKGLDESMTALQAAPAELGFAQMMPVILLAKGLARQEGDGTLAWAIESTPAGSITINGTDLSKMTASP
jgi:hypothetical protein